jgi:hypothetical protein
MFPAANYERPIYKDLNRTSPEYWNFLVDELLLSRVPLILLHGRGCFDKYQGDDGAGSLCPRLLRYFVAAVHRAGAGKVIRVGMWDDTGTSVQERMPCLLLLFRYL